MKSETNRLNQTEFDTDYNLLSNDKDQNDDDTLILKTKFSVPVPAISHIHFRRSYEEAIKNSELTSNLSYPSNFINKKLKLFSENLTKPSYLRAGIFAQLVSVFICCTGIINSELGDTYNINIPTAQSVVNYILLVIVYAPLWYYQDKTEFKQSIKLRWWKYFLIALTDVEANYLIIKAYSMTILTTIQVIDAFILPITLILSYFCIKLRYKFNHLLGVIACLCGCGLIITADYLVQIESGKDGGKHRISGDILCFLASVLYAVSNVSSEMFIKQNSKLEYLSMIGFMGTAISLSQMLLLEREEISNLLKLNNLFIWWLFVVESVSMFLIYSIIPLVLETSSAAFLNVNLLTSDFYSVLVGVFLRKYQLHFLYFVGLLFVLFGTILYSIRRPKMRSSNAIGHTKIVDKEKEVNSKDSSLVLKVEEKF